MQYCIKSNTCTIKIHMWQHFVKIEFAVVLLIFQNFKKNTGIHKTNEIENIKFIKFISVYGIKI